MEIMLNAGKFLAQHSDVMVVDQGDGAYYMGVRRFPRLLHQFIADQIAKGLRAVGIPAPANQLIEFVQEAAIDGDANPTEGAHAYIIVASAKLPSEPRA